jgi:mannan endo-1,6-alpha-mannosidase
VEGELSSQIAGSFSDIPRLRWQVYQYLTGYDYKNTIANGCFFNLGARLARYTDNATYASFAEETWNWVTNIGLMDAQYNIYDGAHVETNCTDINKIQFSYNMGVWTLGAATMWNYVSSNRPVRVLLLILLRRTVVPSGSSE